MCVIINSTEYFYENDFVGEEWKDIKDFEGLYQISNYSRVRSLKSNKILKCGISSTGYYVVNLYNNKKHLRKYASIHRLVAQAFIPNPENKPQVNHINGIKKDSYLYNLEWNTSSENTQHAYNMGLTHLKTGAESPNAIPISQYTLDGKFIKHWGGATCARNELGINKSNIIQCCKGNVKTAGGYIWKYFDKEREVFKNE